MPTHGKNEQRTVSSGCHNGKYGFLNMTLGIVIYRDMVVLLHLLTMDTSST